VLSITGDVFTVKRDSVILPIFTKEEMTDAESDCFWRHWMGDEVLGLWPRGGNIGPDECIEFVETRNMVLRALKTIPKRFSIVIRLRFGLDGDEPKTLKEVGLALGGVGAERIRQIQNKALRDLRKEIVTTSTTLERMLGLP
jgi:DNA-directed RNA polymerase sigma subunit (sigma70/sigma32)